MSLLRNIRSGLRSLFRKEQVDRELDEELRAYQEMAAEEKMKDGASRKEALRAVRLERGSLEVSKEIVRSGGWESVLETWCQDLRFGFRTLRKSSGFTAAAVLTLALGIGANTAIFTLLHASLWTSLPVSDPREIFHLMRASSEGDFAGESSYSYPLFQQFSKAASPWGEVFATEIVRSTKFGLNGVSDERVAGEAVSDDFFSVLNVGLWSKKSCVGLKSKVSHGFRVSGVLLIEAADNPRPVHKLCRQTQDPKQDHHLESPRARPESLPSLSFGASQQVVQKQEEK